MSIIYSFLQKRKMHENQHGYVMVFIAYLLAGLLLALGSDTFYNINSKAADINTEVEEGTRISSFAAAPNITSAGEEELISMELIDSESEFNDEFTEDDLSTSGDTVWMFGTKMNGETFDTLMQQTGVLTPKSKSTTSQKSKKLSVTYKTAYGDVTSSEVDLLERIVQAEAGGEDIVGKVLIANVVLNRVNSARFPNTIKGVITQHSGSSYQFSPVRSQRFWNIKISSGSKDAVQKALKGVDYSQGAMYFIAKGRLSDKKAKEFDTRLDWLFKHGGHDFYKRK